MGRSVQCVPAGPAAPVPKDDLWPHMALFGDHLTEMLEFRQPAVVHAHFWMSAWAAARAVRRLNIPLVVTFHVLGSVKRRYQGPADTSPLNRIRVEVAVAGVADRIVATATEEVRELALLGVPSSKVSVVPCGVDLEHFTPAATMKASPSVPQRSCRYRLLSVGRLVPRKGYETTIEALTWLPETELLIAGGASSDATPVPEHDRLVAIAERIGSGWSGRSRAWTCRPCCGLRTWSSARRGTSRSASCRWKRWHAAYRSWPVPLAACWTQWWTA